MEPPSYSVTRSDKRVDAWSTERLPFEAKGWLRDYRSELQAALRSMKQTHTSILYAQYAAPDAAFADLENVLLYNLGSGCYSHLAQSGIICRRTRSVDRLHHVTYTCVESADVTAPAGPVLATALLSDMPLEVTSPAIWWAAFRKNHLHLHESKQYGGEFGVRAELGSSWRRSLSPSVKALLDGLIAALHVHDGSERSHVVAALNDVGDGERLWQLINDPGIAILGQRRLVGPHGRRIAWNPADERCGYFAFVRGKEEAALSVTTLRCEIAREAAPGRDRPATPPDDSRHIASCRVADAAEIRVVMAAAEGSSSFLSSGSRVDRGRSTRSGGSPVVRRSLLAKAQKTVQSEYVLAATLGEDVGVPVAADGAG